MSRNLVHRRWAFFVLVLAALAVLMVHKGASGNRDAPLAKASSASAQHPMGSLVSGSANKSGAGVPHRFSEAYDYCYVDADGRPMVFHRRRLVFFLPDSPPEVNDRTFIETDQCQ